MSQSEAYLGEIRIFAGTFAPVDWSFCDGQLLAIVGNEGLFSLLGTNYGGDGRTSFGLPDLRGRLPMHFGDGTGLTLRALGQRFGSENVTLAENEIPLHTHTVRGSTSNTTSQSPAGAVTGTTPDDFYASTGGPQNNPLAGMIQEAGASQPHNNLMPFAVLNFIICIKGIYPQRS